VVTLVPALNQALTGACVAQGTDVGAPGSGGPVNYWDIGVRGDTGPAGGNQLGAGSTDIRLMPRYSILSSGGYTGNNNLGNDPLVVSQYCNGARIPPENCTGVAAVDQPRCKGYNAPAGRSEFTGLPVVFALNQLTVAATVDEGNNWVNLGYGPLALANAATAPGTGLPQALLGDYSITAGSPAFNTASSTGAPDHDFFGRTRPQGGAFDIGAVEIVVPPPPMPTITVLDDFNRANANTLLANWSQVVLLGQAAIRVNANQASDPSVPGWAIWNGAGNVFGAKQAAAFTFANTTLNNSGLILKASGGSLTTPANYILVSYASGQVAVATTNNGNSLTPNYVTHATFPAAFASGDTLTAMADATGIVHVWKTTGATTTFIGSIAIPTSGTGAWTQATGGGRIGMRLPAGGRVDNFAGGTVP
jgi:hypothetical protein